MGVHGDSGQVMMCVYIRDVKVARIGSWSFIAVCCAGFASMESALVWEFCL